MKQYAFPHTEPPEDLTDQECGTHYPGMTLRDYFAAKAMQGLLACDRYCDESHWKIATWAYEQADAMLKEREK